MDLNHQIIQQFLAIQNFESTFDSYRKALNQFYEWAQEHPWQSEQGIQDYYYHLQSLGTLNENSAMNYMRIVKSFVTWLFKQGFVESNFGTKFETPKSDRFLKDRIHANGYDKLLATFDNIEINFKNIRNYLIVLLMVRLGLREIEIYRADRKDLKSIDGKPALLLQRKGHHFKDKYVHVPDFIMVIFDECLAYRTDTDLALVVRSESAGGRLSTRSIREVVTKHLTAAGLKSDSVTAYSLRHEAISRALEEGAEPRMVQEMAGHEHFSTTERYYINRLNRSKRAAELIDY